MIASESVALDTAGYKLERDIKPGEAIFIDIDGKVHTRLCAETNSFNPCIFEYVYFARPDSIIDGISVYKARMNMGTALANNINKAFPNNDIDVVIPIPDTSRISALELSTKLKIPFREGFIKNRYIGRTFIMSEQNERSKSVKRKLNAIKSEFRDKTVLLVDDSIVRGTTSRQIVEMAREAGAKKVYMASAAPPVKFPNVYGIDMPASKEFIADNRSIKQVADFIGCDKIFYQDINDLIESVKSESKEISNFDSSCFNGKYITGHVDKEYLSDLDKLRNDAEKTKNNQAEQAFDEVVVY
jgi:amidophosphoribosyltransferase